MAPLVVCPISISFIFISLRLSAFADWSALHADIGSSGNVRGIERWTDGLKWGPSRVRDVSHSLSICLSVCLMLLSSTACLVIRYRRLR